MLGLIAIENLVSVLLLTITIGWYVAVIAVVVDCLQSASRRKKASS